MKNQVGALQLINVTEQNGELLVSGRDLHEALEVPTQFTHWIQSQFENVDAVENVDYTALSFQKLTAQGNEIEFTDYAISISTAKEICMVVGANPRVNARTKELSKKCRKYFIKCEEQLKTQVPALTVEQKMVLDIVFPEDDVQQALAVQVYGNYKYNSGHEVGYEKGHEEGFDEGFDKGYDECASYSMSTTVMVKKLNEKRGGSFNGKRLTTTVFFDYLGYLGYGQRKMVKGSRQFFATDEFIEIMKEDRLGRVDVIGQGKYKRHVFKWSEEWIKVLNLDKLEAYMTLTDKDTKGY